MPLPKPKDGEQKDDFISRCMSDDVAKDEVPDNDQRLAMCYRLWDEKDETNSVPFETSPFERRYFDATEMRLKEPEDAEGGGITGYAAVFDSWSEDLGFFKEQIAPGAFGKTIKNGDVRALINHDPNLVIGRTKNGTLRLWEDDKGLGYEVDLPETSYARDLRESIRRKDITQNSFGFQVVRDEWSDDGKRRTLREVQLFDISPVTFPAYKQTNVKLRLREIGIDYDALGVAMIRVTRGHVLDSDVELIRSTIKTLGELIPDPAAPVAEVIDVDDPDHPAPELAPDLASTLIRARLAESELKKRLHRRIF